jgi:hypothetical protein
MRSRIAAALPLLLILAACESPTAPEIEAVLPAAGGTMAAQAEPSPKPALAGAEQAHGFALDVDQNGAATVSSLGADAATLTVVWYQRIEVRPGRWEWRHSFQASVTVAAGGAETAPPDCFYYGRYRVIVSGQPLLVERDFGPSAGQPYCGTGPGVWTW